MILIFTGNGKGKTSAATGIALRAWGQGKRVLIISFLKGDNIAGEFKAIRRLGQPGLEIHAFGRACLYPEADCCPGRQECLIKGDIDAQDDEGVRQALAMLRGELAAGVWELIVLDEIINVFNIFPVWQEAILGLLDENRAVADFILTGRNCPPELAERADLLSEITADKHPFEKGLQAKRGIDY